MSDNNYLYLMCNPDKWFGEGAEKNYQVNELLYNLDETSWGVSHLKNIFIGMQGIIKVSRDDRPLYFLDEYNVKKLESGIYATFEVIDFHPDKKDGSVTIKVIENLFREDRIIDKEKSKSILGNKFSSQSQGYINRDTFKLVYKALKEIPYKDVPKPIKGLVVEDSKEVYPRDIQEKENALKLANYQCEIDKKHTTFTARVNNKNYVEGHHLIPINQYDKFQYDIDVQANIISLCPTCHRQLHSGINTDVDKILNKLYESRKERLMSVGLEITLDELQKIYYKGL